MSIEVARAGIVLGTLWIAGAGASCATAPVHASRMHDRMMAIAASPADGLPVLTGMRDRQETRDREDEATPDTSPAETGQPAAGGASEAVTGTAESRPDTLPLSMVPSRGAARKRIVGSALRLVGVLKSFDERSFLGHVLIINDVLPRGESSLTYTAATHRDRARTGGAWVEASRALPGDVVVFPCASGCGAGAADGVAAGIVQEYADDSLRFVAYVDGEVRNCWWGRGGDGTRIRKVEGVVRTYP